MRLRCVIAASMAGLGPATAAANPVFVVDATAVPGIELVMTVAPSTVLPEGVRSVAARVTVTTSVITRLHDALPISWMVSALKKGEFAPNVLTRPYADAAEKMTFTFPGRLEVTFSDSEWQIPNFDANDYTVRVGYGMGTGIVNEAYSVPCRPGARIKMALKAYEAVRSDGENRIGQPVDSGQEAWDLPYEASGLLVFDSRGIGTLIDLP